VNIPARQVSGDFYGYVELEDGRLGVAIADVSGKGVPASLIMAMCRSVLHSHALASSSPSAVLHRVNRQIYPDIKEDMFISMAYVVLDNESPHVMLCRAGHDAPLLYSAREQTITRLNPPGMALGIDSGEVFNRITRDFPVTLEPGDCLILYTDGVSEALDANGSEFGLNKMMQSIQTSAPKGAAGIIQTLTAEVLDFIGTHPKNDDITLVAIRRK
jgi:sigma-B regulation protein RsbU (phosphoserine phosphatase)